jgi:hypothetical protein
MSSTPPPAPTPPVPALKPITEQIKIISHSSLYYWWPVWFFGFIFTVWTGIDNYRAIFLSSEAKIETQVNQNVRTATIIVKGAAADRLIEETKKSNDNDTDYYPRIRVSTRSWMGPIFQVILFLVILITNVPLRGLWSLIAIIMIVVVSLMLSLFEKWDALLKAMGDLHIYMNMAGYLAISVALLGAWVLAVMVFDRRTYMIFTPGQLKVCEEIGGREKVYDTTGISLEKRRDDWFRHIILGFGTGDLTVKTSGADRHEIVLPNVAFIGSKISAIEQMLRSRQTQIKV